jgi:hypothetical protein
LELARPVRENILERQMLRDSKAKAKMKLTLQRNKPGNAGRLRRIRNTVPLGGLGILIPCSVVFAQAPDNSKTTQQDRSSAMADQQAENQVATWRERSVKR